MKTAAQARQNLVVESAAPLAALGFLSPLGLLCFSGLCLLLFIAPFYLSGFPAAAVSIDGGAAYVPPMTFQALTAIACVLLALAGEKKSHSRLSLVVAGFGLWCVFSGVLAVYYHDAFLEIARVLACLAWFFVARALLYSEDENEAAKRRFYFLLAIIGGALWACFFALRGFLEDHEFRQSSTFFNANLLANYCAMVLPLALALMFLRRGKSVVFLSAISTIFIFGALASSRSKGGLLALGVALLVLALAAFKARGPLIKEAVQKRKKLFVVGFLIVLIFGGALVQKTVVPRLMQANSGEDNSTQFRVYTWRGTANMIKARPVFGWGPGSYASAYPQFAITGFTLTAHEVWLQLAAENGVPGALLLLAACGLGAAKSWRVLRSENWPIAAACLATIAAFLVHGLTDAGWSLISIALLLMTVLALLDSLPENSGEHLAVSHEQSNLNYFWLLASLLFGAFAAGHSRVVEAESLATQSRESLEKRLPELALQQANAATETDAYSSRGWRNRGRVEQTLSRDARASFSRAAQLQPTKAAHQVALAEELQRHHQDESDILKFYNRAVELEPNDPATRLARADYLLSLRNEKSKQRAWQDYEFIAALQDAPYGKYPAIAEIANFDLGAALIKLAAHKVEQNDKAAARTLLQKAQAIYEIWQSKAAYNHRIASESGTMENFERQEKQSRDLQDEINVVKERLK